MPQDDKNNALVETFKPHGETGGPQVYEFNFKNINHLEGWKNIAIKNSRELGIHMETKIEGNTLWLAVEKTENYSLLISAVTPKIKSELAHFVDYETLDEAYTAHLLKMAEEYGWTSKEIGEPQ